MKRFLLVITLLLISFESSAFEGKVYLGAQVGNVDLHLKDQFLINQGTFINDNIELGIVAGYRMDNNWAFEMAHVANDSVDILDLGDTYNIDQYQLYAGYSWPIASHLRLVPKLGFSFWKLDGTEGQFLNPGDERKVDFSGTDFIWSINFEIPINDLIQLNLSYADNQYEFGVTQTTSFGIKFMF